MLIIIFNYIEPPLLHLPLRLYDEAVKYFRSTLSSPSFISGTGTTGLTGATPAVTGKY